MMRLVLCPALVVAVVRANAAAAEFAQIGSLWSHRRCGHQPSSAPRRGPRPRRPSLLLSR